MNKELEFLSQSLSGFMGGLYNDSPPLIADMIKPVILDKVFFDINKQLVSEDSFLKEIIIDEDTTYKVPSINGKNYELYINLLVENLKRHELLDVFLTVPFGLIATYECFKLLKIDLKKEIYLVDRTMFPFEINEDLSYLVISVDKDKDGSCIDSSFSTISIMKDKRIVETYIRIADEDNRWSDWLKFDEDVLLNINYYKIYLGYQKLLRERQ